MKVKKKQKIAQVNPKTLKNFVGESEYGGKGGMAHAKPSGPMRDNPDFAPNEKALHPTKKQAKHIRKELEENP